MTRYKLLGKFLMTGRNLYYKLIIFVEKLSNFVSFSEEFYFKLISYPELPRFGSGMIVSRIRIWIRVLLKVTDPTGSGSKTLISN
jgi:hypothetical protein